MIGTCRPAQRAEVEALGARVVDFPRHRVLEDVRALAPTGVDAVFNHVVGSESLRSSFAMLRTGGILVGYGNASFAQTSPSPWWGLLEFIAWKLFYSFRRRATFFDVWGRGALDADYMFRPQRFWTEFREELDQLVQLLAARQLKPAVARRIPLREAASALAAHRAGGFVGKIVLEGSIARSR